MKEVTINKDALVERIQSNRDAHRGLYDEAIKGYYLAVARWLDIQQENLNTGEPFETYFNEPRPEDHTNDYDVVLDMLSMSVADTITLSQREFAQYVRDEWGWKQEFLMSASNYTSL